MTVGRILGNDIDMGSGFALATSLSRTTRVVLTAKHVVGDQEPSSLQFFTEDKRKIPVERVEWDNDLDVAILHLSEDVAKGLVVGRAVEEGSWQVKTQPRPNDPKLYGTITDTHRRFVKQDGGHEIYVLQLYEKQNLGDYKGYSGSPVVLKSPTDAVIGVLIEQLRSRLSVPTSQPKPATNVLYAIPIQDVLDRFGLTAASVALADAPPFIAAEFPLLPTLDARPNNLPIQLTPLIGREREIRACCTQLEHNEGRLLTLTGPGGIGKTRLGLQVATELLDAFAHGVFFVDLAPLNDPHLVVSSIAQVLGIRETGEQPLLESLKEYLQRRTLLLVLDNFEHLMMAAPVVTELRTSASQLKMLVTSRASLHLSGEQEFAVPSLELPNLEQLPALEVLVRGEAVALFVARAQEKKPSFVVSAANAADVAEICVRLEGLPLAIELAAARIKDMTPREMRRRLTSRLSLLTRGAGDLPIRQQTLRATLDWSHALLHVSEQMLFRRLTVFAGGWTLEAAEEVCAGEEIKPEGVPDLLAQLVDNSQVVVEEQDEATRYRLLETIREYGAEKLQDSGEAATVHERHGKWYLERAEEAEPKLRGLEQVTWLKWLEIEHDNLRVVLRWAEESGETEIALRLAGALWRFWERHSHLGEGRRWLETLLANRSTVVVAVQAKALRGTGVLTIRQGNYEHAIKLFEESLRLYRELGDKSGIAGVLTNMGFVALDHGNYEQAIKLFEESQILLRELDDKFGIVEVLTNMGFVAIAQGDYGRATSLNTESLDLAQELGDKHSIAMALSSLGEVARYQGDYEHAISLYEKGLTLRRELGDKDSIAFSLTNLGEAALDQGDYEHAISLFKEGLALARELGDKELITYCLEEFAAVAGAQRQPVRAARMWGAAELLRATMGIPLSPANQYRYERYIAVARTLLDTTAFETAWREGQAMLLEQAIIYALG